MLENQESFRAGEGPPPVWKHSDGKTFDTPPVWWPHFASAVIEMQSSAYNMSATVIIMRAARAARAAAAAAEVRKRVFLRHLYIKMHHFAKTGSGQT